MKKSNELVELDFIEHDTIAALQYLIGLCESGNIAGIVFVAAMKRRKRHQIYGATGRPASNIVEAAGLSGMLHLHMLRAAVNVEHV
jgi:hypothetical protein